MFSPVAHATDGPSARIFGAIAAQSDGDHVVLYGGQTASGEAIGDTWVYDHAHGWVAKCGTTTPATPACAPGVRTGEGLGTGPDGVVLYGGFQSSIGDSPAGDTWRWNGTSWIQVCDTAACGPGARGLAAMAGNGSTVVLFGGLTPSGTGDDTWVFDGTTWTQTCGSPLPTPCGPSQLAAASMAWDGQHFVMFGGADGAASNASVDDTWVFDGTTWTQACGTSNGGTACGPAARQLSAFSFAPHTDASLRGAVLVSGGTIFSDTTTLYRDAWFWNGTRWTKLQTSWDGPPETATDAGPPAGPDPLLGYAAPRAGDCQVLFLGIYVASSDGGALGLGGRTYTGGRDLTGNSQPDVCVAAQVTTTTATTTPTTPPSTVAPAQELPRTGASTMPMLALGVAMLAAGTLAVSWRRATTSSRR